MAKKIPENDLINIEKSLGRHPKGLSAREIAGLLKHPLPQRTLQFHLKHLVDSRRIQREGTGRWSKYRLFPIADSTTEDAPEALLNLSVSALAIQKDVRRPLALRKPVGYQRSFLGSYRPNIRPYLKAGELKFLAKLGKAMAVDQPAGTYAKKILGRLLIDLSWNSSRLEGNTYSMLDTKRLIEFGEEADGKAHFETQMILNHKDAIEFLVEAADDIAFNRYTILNLHGILANHLLPDPAAKGRLRKIPVGIEKSVFHPLEVPQLIEESFDQTLAKASEIENPFEQALFTLVHLPYLQPFEDVNKRVSRLAANIPFIKQNLPPLSFVDVPQAIYTEAILGIYELNKIDLMKEVFLWAYERSVNRYVAVRQSLSEPDPFRFRYRALLYEIMGRVVRGGMGQKKALGFLRLWIKKNIPTADQSSFHRLVENELLGLHEGNFARYRLKPSEFKRWQKTWAK